MKNKKIPLVIITSLLANEFSYKWEQNNGKGIWILKNNEIEEFPKFSSLLGNITDWELFQKTEFSIPSYDIAALVLDGNTNENKPHQLEILWHLIYQEKCQIDLILIHPTGNRNLVDIEADGCNERYLHSNYEDLIEINDSNILFKDNKKKGSIHKIPYYAYTIGGSGEKEQLGRWIEIIAEGVKFGNYECVVKKLEEIHQALSSKDMNKIQENAPKSCFPVLLLKNRILHLFLPLDVDLQGLKEVSATQVKISLTKGESSRFKNEPEKQDTLLRYLKAILNNKDSQYYRRKLADLQYILAKEKMEASASQLNEDDPCNELKARHVKNSDEMENFMKEINSIFELLENYEKLEKRERENNVELKGLILLFAGLIKKNNTEQNKIGSYNGKYITNTDAPIFVFMSHLDCLAQKKANNNLGINDVLELFAKEKELFENLNSDIKKLMASSRFLYYIKQLKDFHTWFCALNFYLEKTIEILK